MGRTLRALERLLSRQTDPAIGGVSITYRRGNYSVTFDAGVGSMLLRLTDPGGASRTIRTNHDYIFSAALLILNSQQTTPGRGDLIDEEDANGVTTRWQVLPPGPGEKWFRYADPYKTILRVHVVEKETL